MLLNCLPALDAPLCLVSCAALCQLLAVAEVSTVCVRFPPQDVKTLKRLVLHNPVCSHTARCVCVLVHSSAIVSKVTLRVNDSDEGEESRLTQFHIK